MATRERSLSMKLKATLLLALIAIAAPVSATAHGAAVSHKHADRRMTPQDARTHETGQLPVARGTTVLPDNAVSMTTRGQTRLFTANDIPDHAPGRFPNRGNPNAVSAQSYDFQLPLDPAPPSGKVWSLAGITSDRGFLFGIALNGVPFEPAIGMNWTPEGIHRGGRSGDWVYEAIGGAVECFVSQERAEGHVPDQRCDLFHIMGLA